MLISNEFYFLKQVIEKNGQKPVNSGHMKIWYGQIGARFYFPCTIFTRVKRTQTALSADNRCLHLVCRHATDTVNVKK